MEEIRARLHPSLLSERKPSWKVGDVLELVYEDFSGRWKVRKFTGICISCLQRGGSLRYTLRNVFNNIPVELSFDYMSPLVVLLSKTQIYKSTSKSRAKLYYLRRRRITDSRV